MAVRMMGGGLGIADDGGDRSVGIEIDFDVRVFPADL
jgi:hypothetical protein